MRRKVFLQRAWLVILLLGGSTIILAQGYYFEATTKSDEAHRFYEQAVEAFYRTEYPQMFELTERALKADPEFFMGYVLGSFHFQADKKEWYLNKVVQHKGRLNKGERIIKQMAEDLIVDSQASITQYWKEIIKKYPDNLQLMAMWSFMLFNQDGQEKKTIWALDECLKLKANLPFVYKFRGYIFLKREQFEKAEYAFNRYVWLVPEMGNPYDSKGDYYMAIKDYDNAIDNYRRAYELNSGNSHSLEKMEAAKMYNDSSGY
ncbi:MAG: hypothetical protein JEZ14_03805 [Marinilabiliaceae bacterium]|nr:hypothetical protein [Marinilabiliaceae bacterium]